MNKNVVFTIVAKNYIGLAQILESSFKMHNDSDDFYIIVADDFADNKKRETLPPNILIAKDILKMPPQNWVDMTFKYDLTEFCTSIKPSSFLYFVEKGYDKIIYLDPDVYVYNSFQPIHNMLENYSIVLTPHITSIRKIYNGELQESSFMGSGVFNLGFCGVRNTETSKKMLSWWHQRLLNNCFNDNYNFYFTDQKWMDFLPCYFSNKELHISQHLGMNIAPWNYFERELFVENNEIKVRYREDEPSYESYPVLFVHYSGYNYFEMKNGNVVQKNIENLIDYKDIKLITEVYVKSFKKNIETFDNFIKEKYLFDFYENGEAISKFHRRLYRSLVDKGMLFGNPFSVENNSLYQKLKKKGMISKSTSNNVKLNRDNLNGMERKLKIFNAFTRILYKTLGIDKYTLLIRLFGPFSRFESQIHLINSDFDKDNIKR